MHDDVECQFVFDVHAHLSSYNIYPCSSPAAATEALNTSKVSHLPVISN